MDNIKDPVNKNQITQQQGESGETLKKSLKNLQESVKDSECRRVEDRETIAWLWALMTDMYGHKWTSSYGVEADPNRVWQACLKGISRDQIKHGLNQCVQLSLEWPPSAPEFKNLCEGEKTIAAHKIAQKNFPPLLPISNENKIKRKVAGRRELDKILSMLKGEDTKDSQKYRGWSLPTQIPGIDD